MSLLPLTVSMLLVARMAAPSLHGTIRDRDTGEPIERVSIEVLDEDRFGWSDSAGSYELRDLTAGSHRARFSRLGYAPVEIEVVLPPSGALRVDVTLAPNPVELARVELVEPRRAPTEADLQGIRGGLGSKSLSADQVRLDPSSGEPDMFQSLTAYPDVMSRPEFPSGLHIRGGSGDQNLVLLDGIPVFGPHHSGGIYSSLDAEVLDRITLHAGIPPARVGNGLSSVIEVDTRRPGQESLRAQGRVGLVATGQTLEGPLPGGVGGFLVSGRRSYRQELFGEGESAESRLGDLFAKATLDLPYGTLDVLSFRSNDRLGFDANVGADDLDGTGPAERRGPDAGTVQPGDASFRNRFSWASRMQALVWRQARGDGGLWQARLWQSGLETEADWALGEGSVSLTSALSSLGLGGEVRWTSTSGPASAGFGIEQIRSHYGLDRFGKLADGSAEEPLDLRSGPTLVSGFFEKTLTPSPRWAATLGLRGQIGSALAAHAEPRVSLSFAPVPDLLLSGGYARTYQNVQSLRNEESIIDVAFGADLPLAAGPSPVPRSDQLAASVGARLPSGMELSLEGYTRWLKDVAVVAPFTSQPFATDRFGFARGRASGVNVTLARNEGALSGQLAYAFSKATRQLGELTYHPSFDRRHSVNLALGYQLRPSTRLRAALWAATGAPTTALDDALNWEPFDALSGEREISGSPQRTAGPLNQDRLPPYVRMDVGLRNLWLLPLGPRTAEITAFVDLINVLDRRNALGYVTGAHTAERLPLPMRPRSLNLGLEWRY